MGLNKLIISNNVTQKLSVYQQNCKFLIFEWYPPLTQNWCLKRQCRVLQTTVSFNINVDKVLKSQFEPYPFPMKYDILYQNLLVLAVHVFY